MRLLKRNAVTIRAKYPMLEWLHSIPELEADELTLADVNAEATILLIPEMESEEAVQAYLKSGKGFLMEQELEEWCEEREVWPRPINAALFDEWFSLEYHSLVWDTVEEDEEEE